VSGFTTSLVVSRDIVDTLTSVGSGQRHRAPATLQVRNHAL